MTSLEVVKSLQLKVPHSLLIHSIDLRNLDESSLWALELTFLLKIAPLLRDKVDFSDLSNSLDTVNSENPDVLADLGSILDRLSSRFPKSSRVNLLRGLLHQANGRLDAARKVYAVELELDSSNQTASKLLAMSYYSSEKPKAVEKLVAHLEIFMQDAEAWDLLAQAYLDLFSSGYLNSTQSSATSKLLSPMKSPTSKPSNSQNSPTSKLPSGQNSPNAKSDGLIKPSTNASLVDGRDLLEAARYCFEELLILRPLIMPFYLLRLADVSKALDDFYVSLSYYCAVVDLVPSSVAGWSGIHQASAAILLLNKKNANDFSNLRVLDSKNTFEGGIRKRNVTQSDSSPITTKPNTTESNENESESKKCSLEKVSRLYKLSEKYVNKLSTTESSIVT